LVPWPPWLVKKAFPIEGEKLRERERDERAVWGSGWQAASAATAEAGRTAVPEAGHRQCIHHIGRQRLRDVEKEEGDKGIADRLEARWCGCGAHRWRRRPGRRRTGALPSRCAATSR
jgi:hypothetical protein